MKKYAILILSILLGTILRLWNLETVPNGLTWDEAAIGYNAYSILKTGRDEHGAFMPVIFKSFGDYKPGAYIYITVPSVAIFGLNEFAVRFPSALAGVIGILGVFLLVKEILVSYKPKGSSAFMNLSPQFAALALAISPWHVHFSHSAWEVNVSTTLSIFFLYYLLRFTRGQSSLLPAAIFACLSLAMYQAAKLLIPLLSFLVVGIHWSDFWRGMAQYLNPKKALSLLPFILFGLWILFGSILGSAGNRLSTLSIFNYRPGISEVTKAIDGPNNSLTSLFHHQAFLTTTLIASRYLYHFSPEVLFYEGPVISERGHIPSLGVLHPLEIIWLVLGVIWLSRNLKTIGSFILGLLLIAPIPASLTLAEFSTVRALFMVVPLAIIAGIGASYALSKFKLLAFPFFVIYFFVSVYVFDVYFNHSQTAFAPEFNYGYKQVVQLVKDNPADKVVFTDVYGQPYIYYLFYTAYDPTLYQQNLDFIDGGLDVGKVGRVGNVEFHQFGTHDLLTQKNVLFIGSEGNINNQFDIAGNNVALFRQIETPDHKIIFRVIKTKD